MDLNKLASEIYNASYQDELQKLSQQDGLAGYAPAAVAAAAFLASANPASQAGRSASEALVPIADWLRIKGSPDMGLGKYVNTSIGNRYGAAHLGTLGGLAGAGVGSYLLYNYLKDKMGNNA